MAQSEETFTEEHREECSGALGGIGPVRWMRWHRRGEAKDVPKAARDVHVTDWTEAFFEELVRDRLCGKAGAVVVVLVDVENGLRRQKLQGCLKLVLRHEVWGEASQLRDEPQAAAEGGAESRRAERRGKPRAPKQGAHEGALRERRSRAVWARVRGVGFAGALRCLGERAGL